MLTIAEARKLVYQEEAVVSAYNFMLEQAQVFFDTRTITKRSEEDQIMFRKVGVCDYHRRLRPDSKKTDIEIIENFQRLNKLFEEEKHGRD